jgi:N-acetylmuramoyl-L-alanine amidase
MPSVLVELGYISNRNEEQFMNSSKGQDLLARSLYKAFANYKRNFDLRSGKPVVTVVMEPEMEEDPLEVTAEQKSTSGK